MHYLKRNVFSDIDLERVASMDADQRRELKLSQIDKMLGMGPYAAVLNWYLSQFVDDDNQRRTENPLYDEEDTPLVVWYLEVAELGYVLSYCKAFCLDLLAPGFQMDTDDLRQQFTIDNQQLIDWLQQTPYRRVAAMVAKILIRVELDRVVGHNDAVQDYFAENCSTGDIDTQEIDNADKFINDTIEVLTEMKQHAERGRQLGLNDELVDYICVLTDGLCGRWNQLTPASEADPSDALTFAPDLDAVQPRAEFKAMLKGPWFDKYCSNKAKYDTNWREKFVEALFKSPYAQTIIESWADRSLVDMFGIIGILKDEGVMREGLSDLALARSVLACTTIQKKDKTISKYIGDAKKHPCYYWVKEYLAGQAAG